MSNNDDRRGLTKADLTKMVYDLHGGLMAFIANHSLLRRQLKKVFGETEAPEELVPFLKTVTTSPWRKKLRPGNTILWWGCITLKPASGCISLAPKPRFRKTASGLIKFNNSMGRKKNKRILDLRFTIVVFNRKS